MNRCSLVNAALALASLGWPITGQAQVTTAATPSMTVWTFGASAVEPDPLTGQNLKIQRVWQFTAPLGVAAPIGKWITVDASGAYSLSEVDLGAPDAALHTTHYTLDGLTDIKVRVVAHLVGDNVLLSLGGNAPSGTTSLSTEQLKALSVVAAPALELPTPTLGVGPSGTGGIVLATRALGWAWALGSSYEMRGSYTPYAAFIAAVQSPDYQPGNTLRFDLGADGYIGQSEMTFALGADVFSHDELEVPQVKAGPLFADIELGPELRGSWSWQLVPPGFHSLTLYALDRYRSKYSQGGVPVGGTWGNYADAGIRGAIALGSSTSWIVGLHFIDQTGLAIDHSFASAGILAGGLTLGIDQKVGPFAVQQVITGQYGRLDLGAVSPMAASGTVGLSIRWRQ